MSIDSLIFLRFDCTFLGFLELENVQSKKWLRNNKVKNRETIVMLNVIRWWFKSKWYTLSTWIRRPRNVAAAVNQVVSAMEALGIVVVDASVYPVSEKNRTGAAVIVAGYIPNKATCFTVSFNYGTFDDYKFTIDGQASEDDWNKIYQGGVAFRTLKRHAVGCQSYGCDRTFSINTYTSYNTLSRKSSKKKVVYGMAFFKKFLDEYGASMASRFTSSVHLWFIPVYSDEYKALVKKNGDHNSANYTVFNTRVRAKFPKDFFCSQQRA